MFGEVTELQVVNVDQHPYHHHVQPYQIVALDNDTDEMNAWWRVSLLANRLQTLAWYGGTHDLRAESPAPVWA